MASSSSSSATTAFLSFKGETKKVTSQSFDDLTELVKKKFPEVEELNVPDNVITFDTMDKKFGVSFTIEDPNSQIYDGAVIEVKIPDDYLANSDISRELEEMKRKINKLENKDDERTSKKRRVDSGERHVVRIRGLPWEATVTDIKNFFREQTILEDGVTMVTNNQGRSTGEAFVEFGTKEDLEGALKKDKLNMGRRYIEVYRTTVNEVDRARGVRGTGSSGPKRVPFSDTSAVVRMRGLPYAANEADVFNFYDKLRPTAIHLPKDHLGRPSGDSFVEFENDYDVSRALELNKKNMGHRYVEIFRSSIAEMCLAMGVNRHTGNIAADTDKCIRMQGLPWNCTEHDITRFFQEAHVTPTRIHRKSDGGEAYCEFFTTDDAHRAMSRHKQYIGRRYIELFRVSYIEMAKVVGLSMNPPPENNFGGGAGGFSHGGPAPGGSFGHPNGNGGGGGGQQFGFGMGSQNGGGGGGQGGGHFQGPPSNSYAPPPAPHGAYSGGFASGGYNEQPQWR